MAAAATVAAAAARPSRTAAAAAPRPTGSAARCLAASRQRPFCGRLRQSRAPPPPRAAAEDGEEGAELPPLPDPAADMDGEEVEAEDPSLLAWIEEQRVYWPGIKDHPIDFLKRVKAEEDRNSLRLAIMGATGNLDANGQLEMARAARPLELEPELQLERGSAERQRASQERAEAQDRVGVHSGLDDLPAYDSFLALRRYPRPPEPELTDWDLRAKMEKRKRQRRQQREWDERRAAVGRYPSLGADWRTDARITDTGDPTAPTYREWTHREVWDLITLNGINADPRDVELWVQDPLELADAPAQGSTYTPDMVEYMQERGLLIKDEDLAAVLASAGDKDGDAALLDAEFDAFDEQLSGFDASGFGGGGDDEDGGGNEDDDGF